MAAMTQVEQGQECGTCAGYPQGSESPSAGAQQQGFGPETEGPRLDLAFQSEMPGLQTVAA